MKGFRWHNSMKGLEQESKGWHAAGRMTATAVTTVLIVMAELVFASCGSNEKEQAADNRKVEHFHEPEPEYHYQPPLYPLPDLPDPEPVEVQEEKPVKVEEKKPEKPTPQPTKETTISRYYEEGYENGYDDGMTSCSF